jgi:hypothetical protein
MILLIIIGGIFMKFNIKSAILGCVVGVMVSSGVSVFAYNGTKNISATFKNIKIYVDGSELTPRDSNGNVLEPFIYNGSTYLPVRAVGEAIGKNVSYDGNTNSIYIGKSGQSNQIGSQIKAYSSDGGWEESIIKMAGNNYSNCIKFNRDGNIYYNLNGMYSSLSGVYGFEDSSSTNDEASVVFYGDGKQLKSFIIKGNELPKNFDVNISGVAQLKIEVSCLNYSYGDHPCLGNLEVK